LTDFTDISLMNAHFSAASKRACKRREEKPHTDAERDAERDAEAEGRAARRQSWGIATPIVDPVSLMIHKSFA
jgi:hypothetical protein